LTASEGFVEVPGGRVWYRMVGSGGVPLLCLHGGPGFCHDYIEAIADLADERRIIFYDQLGCGRSPAPDDRVLWQLDRFVDELVAVRGALELDRVHLFGSSWGGMLALQYVLDRRPRLDSLIVSNSPGSMPRFAADNLELLASLPDEVRSTIEWHEQRGFTGCPEYQGAIAFWFKRHICRMTPWPDGLERSFAGFGVACYSTMIGASEFNLTGNLADWDVMPRLGEIDLPTLYTAGRHDEIRPDHVEDMHRATRGSRFELFEDSAHLPFEEERERFMALLRSWLAEHDGCGEASGAASRRTSR
jgi:proline-specific peptidase